MNLTLPVSANALGSWLRAEVLGDPDRIIERLSAIDQVQPGSLCYLTSSKFEKLLAQMQKAVVLVGPEIAINEDSNTFLRVADPKRAFVQLATHLFKKQPLKGISPLAQVSPEAIVPEDSYVGPFAVIEGQAKIGHRTMIHPFAFIGGNVEVGDDCTIHPHVVLLESVVMGNRVKVFPGAVLGSEGFGLLQGDGSDGSLTEIPQVGRVVIEDDVRIGAKTTIDRAMLGETRICRGAKLDDQVHVGHNTVVGPNSILCAQSGLSGSVTLGKGVVLGGQAGVADHVTVGDGARMGGQTGTGVDLEGGKDYFLSPAMPLMKALKVNRTFQNLPEIDKRLRQLEKKLDSMSPKE